MTGERTHRAAGAPAPLKVAFAGTCCSGKTTLVEACRDSFADVPGVFIVAEAARAYFEANGLRDRNTTETQRKIQAIALQNERAAHDSGAALILCDRSAVDSAAYSWAYDDRAGALDLVERVRHWLPTYTHLFLLDPADVPYEEDEIRRESEETRRRLHDAFAEVFAAAGVRYELLGGGVEQRVERVRRLLTLEGVGPPGAESGR